MDHKREHRTPPLAMVMGVGSQQQQYQWGGNSLKRIMIFNLKNKIGKSDVECVHDVFGKSCDDVVDVVRLTQKENGPIVRPIIVEFRSEYDKWTVMRMKAKLRECKEYNSFFRDGSVEGREGEVRKARVIKLKEDTIQKGR